MSNKQNDIIIDLIIENQLEGEQKPTFDDVDMYNEQLDKEEQLEIQNQRSLQ